MADKAVTGPLVDMRQVEYDIGDSVAVGFRAGNSGDIRVGTVVGFWERPVSYSKPKILVEIEWEPQGGYWSVKKSKVESDNGRIVKVILP